MLRACDIAGFPTLRASRPPSTELDPEFASDNELASWSLMLRLPVAKEPNDLFAIGSLPPTVSKALGAPVVLSFGAPNPADELLWLMPASLIAKAIEIAGLPAFIATSPPKRELPPEFATEDDTESWSDTLKMC